MTLDEKLNQFYTAAIDNATNQNIQIIDEYKQSLQRIYDDHKEDFLRKADLTFSMDSNNLIREKNRNLSSETVTIKRMVGEKSIELIDRLFQDITQKVESYIKTPEYLDLLSTQIESEIKFAKGEDITIYINPSDEGLKATLESKCNFPLTISNTNFVGGTRAVIHSKNILIDNSLLTKIAEARSTFAL